MSVRHTDASASSCWPTATAVDYGSSQNGSNATRPSARTPSLPTIARRKEWSTPLASDTHAKQQGASDGRPSPWPNLPMQVRAWPTPCTTDASGSARKSTSTGVMHSGISLTDEMRASLPITDGPLVQTTRKGGRGGRVLDPRFVEALMGCPDGWTVPVSPKDCAALVFELLATPLSRSKRLERSASSSNEELFDAEEDV